MLLPISFFQQSFIDGFYAVLRSEETDKSVRFMLGRYKKQLGNYVKTLKDNYYGIWIYEFYQIVAHYYTDRVPMFEEILSAVDADLPEKCREYDQSQNDNALEHTKEWIARYCKEDSINRLLFDIDCEEYFDVEQQKRCMEMYENLWKLVSDYKWSDDAGSRIFAVALSAAIRKLLDIVQRIPGGTYCSYGIDMFGSEDDLYAFLTDRSINAGESVEFMERNFNELEDFLKKYSRIGENMMKTLDEGGKVILDTLNHEDIDRFRYTALLFAYAGMEPERFGKYLMEHYPGLDHEYRRYPYLKRTIVKTAYSVSDIRLHSALVAALFEGYVIGRDDGSEWIEARKIKAQRVESEALETMRKATYLIDEMSASMSEKSDGAIDKQAYDTVIWDEMIKYRDREILRRFGPDRDRDVLPGEYKVSTLKQIIENCLIWALKDDRIEYYDIDGHVTIKLVSEATTISRVPLIRTFMATERHEMIKELKQALMELKTVTPALEDIRMADILDGATTRIREDSFRYCEQLLIESAGSRFSELTNELDDLREQYSKLQEESDEQKAIIEEMERKAAEAAEEIKSQASREQLLLWKETSEARCKEYEEEILSRLGRDRSLLDGVACGQTIRDELFTSEFVFHFLGESLKTLGNVNNDYSAAILPLTKSIEIVLSELLFAKMSVSELMKYMKDKYMDHNGNKNSTNPSDWTKKDANRVELGPLAYLFTDTNNHVDYGILSQKLSGLTITTEKGDQTIGNNDRDNAGLIKDAILYISNNFRNPAAHKEMFGEKGYETARKLIISEQRLLWVLLAIIKP